MFAFLIPSNIIAWKFIDPELIIDVFSFRGPLDFRGGEWNSAYIIPPVLRRSLRGANAGNSHNDPNPTSYANTCRFGNLFGEFLLLDNNPVLMLISQSLIIISAVYGLFVRVGYLRFD